MELFREHGIQVASLLSETYNKEKILFGKVLRPSYESLRFAFLACAAEIFRL